jgi:ribosome-associated protein
VPHFVSKTPKSFVKKENFSKDPIEQLTHAILDAMQEKKGHDILMLDLRATGSAIADYFIICHGTSDTQVEAITAAVEETVIKKTKETPHHIEGLENAQWVIIDYINVIVHIFLEEIRYFYNIEKLWADAPHYKVASG